VVPVRPWSRGLTTVSSRIREDRLLEIALAQLGPPVELSWRGLTVHDEVRTTLWPGVVWVDYMVLVDANLRAHNKWFWTCICDHMIVHVPKGVGYDTRTCTVMIDGLAVCSLQ
jgi:hypothetical protein